MFFRIKPLFFALAFSGCYSLTTFANVDLAQTSQIITINATPNILLIPDTSETMQEGLSQGRIALNWDDTACRPGTNMPARCVAGAKYTDSKASIVKRVGLNLVDNFSGRVNMGLLSYQQYPPSTNRADTFDAVRPRTTLWFLTHRIADFRFSTSSAPDFYQPNHSERWDSPIKRFREQHPTLNNVWVFYNVAVPGYYRSTSEGNVNPPRTDVNAWDYLLQDNGCTSVQCSSYRKFSTITSVRPRVNNEFRDPDSNLWFSNVLGDFNSTFTDSMRARGITKWGNRVAYLSTGQLEWRANASPGRGYLHVPIGGIDQNGKPIAAHWQKIKNKLQPQRTDWDGIDTTIFRNENWPLIAAGLTPLEGTMRTARDYFLGQTTTFFGSDQGNTGSRPPAIPESCGNNAAIWITDGLPSVAANGTALGTNPVAAMVQARNAVKDFYDRTAAAPALKGAVKTYIVGFALPPGVKQLFERESWFPASGNVLDYLAKAGGTEQAYNANDETTLLEALDSIFQSIIRDSLTSSGLASTSTELSTDTKVFQSELNTVNWSGDLLALNISGGARDRTKPAWRAGALLSARQHSSRNIFGSLNGNGFVFRTDSIPAEARNLLKATGETDTQANLRLNYIRGERSNEGTTAGKFRERVGILGHIVNSTPLYVPAGTNRPAMLYIMANDGMLHGFNANTGEELFAYIPSAVLPKYLRYSTENYAGEFMLDGQLAYHEANSKVYLTGTGGTGVKTVFALDVSNPTNFTPRNILWEASGDAAFGGRLGFTGSQPLITKYDGKAALIIGNGYNSQHKKSSLLVIDLVKGDLLTHFDQDGLGFGSPGSLDLTRDGQPDFIYIGDFNGKLWRFALNTTAVQDIAPSQHLFTTENSRPLVVAPVSASHPDGGVMVVFGTGELITTGSRISTAPEYVYALHDRFAAANTLPYSDSHFVKHLLSGTSNRSLTTGAMDAGKAGWRVQLPGGERVMANAAVRRQSVIFGSYKPDNTACSGGGQGYMTELHLFRGSSTSAAKPPSKPVQGIPRTPIFIEIPRGGTLADPTCTENCSYLADNQELVLIGEEDEQQTVIKGRQLWREVM